MMPDCMAPLVCLLAVQVINHKPYTKKVDVYSFGIVLWELITCDLPFKGLTFVQLANSVVNKVGGGGAERAVCSEDGRRGCLVR